MSPFLHNPPPEPGRGIPSAAAGAARLDSLEPQRPLDRYFPTGLPALTPAGLSPARACDPSLGALITNALPQPCGHDGHPC